GKASHDALLVGVATRQDSPEAFSWPTRALGDEGPADQDLLGCAVVGQRAVDPDLVTRYPEATHVVGGHRAGAAPQGDRPYRPEVECDPEPGSVWEVDVVDLDGQDAEAAAAAELGLVRG